MNAFSEFLAWEAASKDTIDFKRAYVDVSGDVIAGLVLSEIIYWHIPNKKTGVVKLRVKRGEHHWIACNRAEWWDRTRLSPRQFDAALKILTDANIVIKEVHGFAAKRSLYVRINEKVFLERLSIVITEDVHRFYPEVKARRRPAKSQISDYGDKSQNSDLPPQINHKSVTSNTTTTSSTTNDTAATASGVKSGSYQATTGKSDAECEAERKAEAEKQLALDLLRFNTNENIALLEKAVTHYFGFAGTRATKYARMLYGRLNVKGKRRPSDADAFDEQAVLLREAPVTPNEFTDWADDYCKARGIKPGDPTMITSPEKVVSAILARRTKQDSPTTNAANFGAPNWQPDFWDTFDGKVGA